MLSQFLIEKLEEKIKEPIKEPSEEPLPMETEEEDPKEEPIKEIKEVKGHYLFPWEPALIVGCSLLVTENPFAVVSFLFFINLFYFWLCWVFIAVRGLSLVAASSATLCCSAWASHCSGFCCCRARALGAWASVVAACGISSCGSRALERRLSSCGARA